MNTIEHLLVCLAEECVEVIEAAARAIENSGAADEAEDERADLLAEIHDLFAVALILQQTGAIAAYNPRLEHVMATLPAEGAEPDELMRQLIVQASLVAQRVAKSLRFGLQETQPGQDWSNAERISHALTGFFSACIALQVERVFGEFHPTPDEALVKLKEIERFMAISRSEGALQDG